MVAPQCRAPPLISLCFSFILTTLLSLQCAEIMSGNKKKTIDIYARMKPSRCDTWCYEIMRRTYGEVLAVHQTPSGCIRPEVQAFRFDKVFPPEADQETIFETIGKPVMQRVLRGYNGTIFAYGQTGAGKTYSMTGGEEYDERGLIPRTLSYMFSQFRQNSQCKHSAYLSYLEIYNERGYDLLCHRKSGTVSNEDVPKVVLLEDSEQEMHLKNVSVHPVKSEEEALELLLLGERRRATAETPMNQASTRSHCIFTIYLASREPGSAACKRSKMHLVDLAGSERVHKSRVDGQVLQEAKSINRALHFLEQVILALGEQRRSHVPYRNSLMTSLLRDSLGGNCLTTMLANLSSDNANMEESISTCRFSQRVALVENCPQVNEVEDPALVLTTLRQEVERLREELVLATGKDTSEQLSEEEMRECMAQVEAFLRDPDPNADLPVAADMRKIKLAFKLLRERSYQDVISKEKLTELNSSQKVHQQVKQRDLEIKILIDLLRKEKLRNSQSLQIPQQQQQYFQTSLAFASPRISSCTDVRDFSFNYNSAMPSPFSSRVQSQTWTDEDKPIRINDTATIKEKLRSLYSEGKMCGEEILNCRSSIGSLRTALELEAERTGIEELQMNARRKSILESLEKEKQRYDAELQKMRDVKSQVEELQRSCREVNSFSSNPTETLLSRSSSSTPKMEIPSQSPSLPSLWLSSSSPEPPLRRAETPHDTLLCQWTNSSLEQSPKPNSRGDNGIFKPSQGLASFQSPHSTSTSLLAPSDIIGGTTSTFQESSEVDTSQFHAITGDEEADEDILAFCQARRRVINHMKNLQNS